MCRLIAAILPGCTVWLWASVPGVCDATRFPVPSGPLFFSTVDLKVNIRPRAQCSHLDYEVRAHRHVGWGLSGADSSKGQAFLTLPLPVSTKRLDTSPAKYDKTHIRHIHRGISDSSGVPTYGPLATV